MTKQTQNILTSHSHLIEQVLGPTAKGLVEATLGETIYEKGGDTYEVLRLLSRSRLESNRDNSLMLAFVTIGLQIRLNLLHGDVQAAIDILNPLNNRCTSKPPATCCPISAPCTAALLSIPVIRR